MFFIQHVFGYGTRVGVFLPLFYGRTGWEYRVFVPLRVGVPWGLKGAL